MLPEQSATIWQIIVALYDRMADSESMKANLIDEPAVQYRVIFTELENVNGDMRQVQHSTKWFASLEEAEQSRWMRSENARIVSREYKP